MRGLASLKPKSSLGWRMSLKLSSLYPVGPSIGQFSILDDLCLASLNFPSALGKGTFSPHFVKLWSSVGFSAHARRKR